LVKGIDIVVWEVWEILLLVFAGLVIVGIGIFFGRMLFGKYQRKKKLVPLLVDYAEYEEDMAEEI
jgi:H+/Cl- antiporter ClcA